MSTKLIFLNMHWQLMALLLLRHALAVTDGDGDDDPSTIFSVSWILTVNLQ